MHLLSEAMFAALASAAAALTPAFAAGGAHVIDDAAVEKAGTCHLESWVSTASGHTGLANSAPACTLETMPNLEIGGSITHSWAAGSHDTIVGLSPKFVFRSEQSGLGVGVATAVGYGLDRGRVESAALVVPLTIPAGPKLRLNLNAGWQWFKMSGNELFGGAQAEIALRSDLDLMIEGLIRERGKPGGQAGIRWTPYGGSVDLDLLAARYVDGSARNAITFGVTLRR